PSTLCNLRLRLIAYDRDKRRRERTVALAEQTGGCGARQLRAALDSPPLFGAGRVEDMLNLLGHALRKAVGLAAQELDTSAEAILVDAGLVLVGLVTLWQGGQVEAAALGLVWDFPRDFAPVPQSFVLTVTQAGTQPQQFRVPLAQVGACTQFP